MRVDRSSWLWSVHYSSQFSAHNVYNRQTQAAWQSVVFLDNAATSISTTPSRPLCSSLSVINRRLWKSLSLYVACSMVLLLKRPAATVYTLQVTVKCANRAWAHIYMSITVANYIQLVVLKTEKDIFGKSATFRRLWWHSVSSTVRQ